MAALDHYLRAVGLVVAFFIAIRGKKSAMFADFVFTTWFGVGTFLFPQLMTSGLFGKEASTESNLVARRLGANFIGMAVLQYLCRKSKDDTVVGSVMWSKSLGYVPLLILTVYNQVRSKFDTAAMCFILTLVGCIIVSNVVELSRSRLSVGRREQKGLENVLCRLLFLLYFLSGLGHMAFPSSVLSIVGMQKKEGLVYLVSCVGALMFSNIFLFWYAPSFRHKEDRKNLFISQLGVCALIVFAQLYCCFVDGGMEASQLLTKRLFYQVLFAVLPLMGYLTILRKERNTAANTYTYYTRSKYS